MYRQVGPLAMDASGVAAGGLLVRHLVMPGDICLSRQVIDTVAEVAPGCTINVMGQYRPAYRAEEYGELAALPDAGEVLSLQTCAENAGLKLAR
jgi:putative pyruvate formate lyase activating enzyme